MQKIEYTCDRCGKAMSSEKSWKVRFNRVLVRSVTGNFERLERYLEGMDKDLCEDCVSSFMKWMQQLS